MKRLCISTVLLFFILTMSGQGYSRDEMPVLEGPYMGQKLPGSTPELFAPGVVSTEDWEVGGAFTPDLNEFYFIRKNKENGKQEIAVFQNKNNLWHESVFSPRVGSPLFSPDGNTMLLAKRYRERTKAGWSELKSLESPFDSLPIMRLSVSSKGTYFFDEFKRDFTGAIRYSRLIDGKYEEPKLLGSEINQGKSFHPFISADESYLIFDGHREGGYGDSDLYISYRKPDGSWGEAINLGDKINTKGWEAVASVTSDGKYLFFSRNETPGNHKNVDIFWVNTQFIETLRPKSE